VSWNGEVKKSSRATGPVYGADYLSGEGFSFENHSTRKLKGKHCHSSLKKKEWFKGKWLMDEEPTSP